MTTIPSAPNGGGYIYMGPSTICISWAEPEDSGGAPITSYMVYLTFEGQPTTNHLIQAPEHTYLITNIVYGINIQAAVKASNDNGISYGPEFVFPLIVPIQAPPAPPASAVAAALEPGTASISWTAPDVAPEGNAHYSVLSVSSNSSDPTVGLGTADMTQHSCVLTGLNPESEYYFTVEIINEVGRSPAAITNTIIFTAAPTPATSTPIDTNPQ
jgi:predicted phage tail protein